MRILFFILLSVIPCISCNAQISFEKGYFINNSGQKIECLIKNIDWKNNPTEFEYRVYEKNENQKEIIKFVEEFGIYNTSKYIRKTVNIDRTTNNINFLTTNKNPVFKKEELFLRVLVEGKSNLYEYVDSNIRRYFYKTENSNIEQLVFKNYKKIDNNIGKNTRFKQQLWNDLKCSNIDMKRLQNIKYTRKDLGKFFMEYNKCSNSELVSYGFNAKAGKINFSFRPRLNIIAMNIEHHGAESPDTDFGNQHSLGFGIEAEYILPFQKNKWGLLFESSYQHFKSSKSVDVENIVGGKRNAFINFKSIEFSFGLRRYFLISEESKIFADFCYIFNRNLDLSLDFKRVDGSRIINLSDFREDVIRVQNNLSIGIGFKFRNKYSMEIRYQTSREVLGNFNSVNSSFRTLSFIFGYSIFK